MPIPRDAMRALLTSCGLIVALLPSQLSADSLPTTPPRTPLATRLGTPGETLVLSDRHEGHALFRAAQTVNRGELLLTDAPSRFEGALTNEGAIEIRGTRVDVQGPVTDHGSLKVTDAEAHYASTFTELGAYISDPSDNYFTDLVIGPSGYLVGGAGDRFFVSGDLVSSSTNNTSWSTEEAALIFRTGLDTLHSLSLTGADLGPHESGYTQNFAWGQVDVEAGNSLTLVDGNATPGGALYARAVVGAQLSGSTVTNFTGASGLAIYYDPADPANAYLGGAKYDLTTDGALVPLGAPAIPLLGPIARLVLMLGLTAPALRTALGHRGATTRPRSAEDTGHPISEQERKEET